MTLLPTLRSLSILLAAFGGGATVLLVWRAPESLSVFSRTRSRYARDLAFLRSTVGAGQLLAAQTIACVLGMAAARVLGAAWPLALVGIAALAPAPWLTRLRAARVARIEAQLDPWLVALANTLRATPSLGEALASTLATRTAPLRDEIDLLLKEYQLGTPLDRALESAAARIGSPAFTALVLTLQVARSSGGGVSECLERAAASLREMLRLDGVVRTKTAEGKTQALVIAVLPGPFFFLLTELDPEFLQPLTRTNAGHGLVAAAIGLWVAAVLLARRIVAVDV